MSDIPLARTIINSSELHKAAPAPNQIVEAWLRPVLQKLLESLDYLHGQGVLHRDINPSNIILQKHYHPTEA
ncbi:MAG: hypothetical protein IJ503_10930 [Akkermansia sp.]|nr:hypothetical protein [Akkermansia sp.]